METFNLWELLVNNKKIEMPVESPLPEKEVKKNHYHVKINLIFFVKLNLIKTNKISLEWTFCTLK